MVKISKNLNLNTSFCTQLNLDVLSSLFHFVLMPPNTYVTCTLESHALSEASTFMLISRPWANLNL